MISKRGSLRSTAGRLRSALLLGLAASLLAGGAGAETWVLDPEQSEVRFSLKARLHTVKGRFVVRSGEVRFPADAGLPGVAPVADGAVSGRIVLDATTADTGNDMRDGNMHEEVLESAKYPEIVFVPDGLAVLERDAGRARIELQGELRIHGTRWRLTIPAELERQGEMIVATGGFTAPYVKWGMKHLGNFLMSVAEEVEVSLEARGRLVPDPPPAAAP